MRRTSSKQLAQRKWFIDNGQIEGARCLTRNLCIKLSVKFTLNQFFNDLSKKNNAIARSAGVKVKDTK